MITAAQQTVLVTGARGFIGSEIVRQLRRTGTTRIVSLGRSPGAEETNEFHTVDLRDRAATHDWAARQPYFDRVIHAAGKIDHATHGDIYDQQIALHIGATNNLLDALQAHNGFEKWVQVGSATEYGDAPVPHDPQEVEKPTGAYGFTKWAASRLIQTRAQSQGFAAIIARPYLTYGRGEDARSFLALAITAAREGKAFPTTGAMQTRDFVSVEKVASDIITLSHDDMTTDTVYNIGTGVETTLRSVLEFLQNRCSGFVPRFGALPYRNGEMMRSVGICYRPLTQPAAWESLQNYLRSVTDVPSTNA